MLAEYYQYPGPYGPTREEWPMMFREDGSVELRIGGTWKGAYKFGTSDSIVHIHSPFTMEDKEIWSMNSTLVL